MRARPISATVFGILNLGYGAYGLIGLLFIKMMESFADKMPHGANGVSPLKAMMADPQYLHWMWVASLIQSGAGLVLMAAGVGLFFCKNWARLTSIGWSVFIILFVIASTPMNWKYTRLAMANTPNNAPPAMAQMQSAISEVAAIFGIVFSLAYPIILLIFMTRPTLVAACKDEAPPLAA